MIIYFFFFICGISILFCTFKIGKSYGETSGYCQGLDDGVEIGRDHPP